MLLVFFKVTCPVCQLTMPFLERLHARRTLPVCGISQNDAADTREFNSYFGVTFPTLLDSEDEDFPVSNAYGISSVPSMFLVEPDGTISRVIEGWNKMDMEALGDARRDDPLPRRRTTSRRGRPVEVRATRFPAGATLNWKHTDG